MSMEWFRWWHGSVTDPKFRVISRKSKTPVATVIGVWAALLEHCSQNGNRGSLNGLNIEDTAEALGIEEELLQTIIDWMTDKRLIAEGRLTAWEKRQAKREREDDSKERVKAHRERKKQDVTPSNATVTPSNALDKEVEVRGRERGIYQNGKGTVKVNEVTCKDVQAQQFTEPERQPNRTEPIGKEITDEDVLQVVALYHQILPMCPPVRVITQSLAEQIKQRIIADDLPNLKIWRVFFEHVATFDLLIGRAAPKNGRTTPFVATLQWLTRGDNYAEIEAGKYGPTPKSNGNQGVMHHGIH